MAEKIRVLQSVNSLGIGGSVIYVMNFFRHIDKERFQVDFVICDDTKMNFYDEIIGAGSNVYICRSGYKNKYKKLFSQVRQIKNILRQNHYNVIHCHSCSFIGIFRGAIAGFLSKGTKVISHAHSVGEPKGTAIDSIARYLLKWVLSHIIDIGCACSDKAGESKYTKKFIASKKYKIINNAIETDKYRYSIRKRNEIRKSLNIKDGDFVVGNVGRLEYEKNHTFLLDIFHSVLQKKPNAVLLLVGDGNLREELEEKAEREGIASRVIFVGRCESAADYYHAMDCFVLPSHYEGFPLVLVEAQVNGLKCIVSENMTRDVDIAGGVRFLSLEMSSKVWAEEICIFGDGRMHTEKVDEVISGYELKYEILKLEAIYEGHF